jgi:hypothetical protein
VPEKPDLTDAQIAILEAIERLGGHADAPDIAAEADVTPTTISRELIGLKDVRPPLVQFGSGGDWAITPDGESAVLDDTLDEETEPPS